MRPWKRPWMQVCFPPAELPGPSGSSNSVAGSRARLVSRRWRPFLTIKARQNALATNFAADKFPCLRVSQRPVRLRAFQHPAVGQTIQSADKTRDRKNCSDKEKSEANFASGVSKPASGGHLRPWKRPWMQVCFPPAELPGPSGSSNSVAGSRARLVSRRWRPFLTIKARQNALATNFAADKFPCLRVSQRPVRLRAFQHPAAVQTAFFLPCGARRGGHSARTGCSLSKAAAGKRGRRSERVPSLHAHRLAKTERMALRRPLCFFAPPRVRRRPWPGLPDAFAIKGTLPPPEPAVAPCPYMNNSRLTAITAMPPMRP